MNLPDNDYSGDRARTYEAKRKEHAYWRLEQEAVEALLPEHPGSVLDLPTGTGRFLPLLTSRCKDVLGVDLSEDMLAEARRKHTRATLDTGNILTFFGPHTFQWVVCIRMLNRLPLDQMKMALLTLARNATQGAIVGIRHGTPSSKGETITHSTEDVQEAFFEAGFVDVRRELIHACDGGGYYIYQLRRLTNPLMSQPNGFFPPQSIEILSHSTSGKSTFCKQGSYRGVRLFDMDDLVTKKEWEGRPDTLLRLHQEHSPNRVCVLGNAHESPLPLGDINYVAVLPPLDVIERNQAARRQWAKSAGKRPGSSKLDRVLEWRESLVMWLQQSPHIPFTQSFEQAIELGFNLE